MSSITPEQRDAWAEVKDQAADVAALLAPLLPTALTNPPPKLPTEPGLYEATDAPGCAWRLNVDGTWWPPFQDYESFDGGEVSVKPTAPLVRLVRVPSIEEMRRDIVNITHLASFAADRPMLPDQEHALAKALVRSLTWAGKP